MPTPDPFLLHLPVRMLDVGFGLGTHIFNSWRCSRSETHRLVEIFAMTRPEIAFVRRLLERKRNLWLYRCNQRRFCGDFVVVDMSGPMNLREALVLELKANEALKLEAGGVQLQNAAEAVAELIGSVLEAGAGHRCVQGSPEVVEDWLS